MRRLASETAMANSDDGRSRPPSAWVVLGLASLGAGPGERVGRWGVGLESRGTREGRSRTSTHRYPNPEGRARRLTGCVILVGAGCVRVDGHVGDVGGWSAECGVRMSGSRAVQTRPGRVRTPDRDARKHKTKKISGARAQPLGSLAPQLSLSLSLSLSLIRNEMEEDDIVFSLRQSLCARDCTPPVRSTARRNVSVQPRIALAATCETPKVHAESAT